MKLFDIFSDNALFQASCILTLRGFAEPGTNVFARLIGHGASTHGRGISTSEGIFEVTIDTPPASLNKYEIEVTDGNEIIILKNIIFGELWIASVQSNMELENSKQFECKEFLDSIKSLEIRAFAQENGNEDDLSVLPHSETHGKWVSAHDSESFLHVSACASAFCKTVFEQLKTLEKEIPIGFINISWGGTPIYGWLSEQAILSDLVVKENLIKRNLFPLQDKAISFQHPCIMYNRKTVPVLGVKARGMLWYQGEFDSFCEFDEHIYKHLLYLLRTSYADMFAKNKADFKIISSLIYPCNYTNSGDTNVGYLNDAFVKAYIENPDTYLCCPVYDLPPSWWPLDTNHPIHPLHKYALGERMAYIALKNVYNHEGQKHPSAMRSFCIEDNRIILTFDESCRGLYTNDSKHVRGMYIAGKDNIYMPADCEILSNNKIAVYHPFLEKPCNCLYGWSSFEVNLNLFSGDYPVLPFATDDNADELIKVELKTFLNLEVESELEWFEDAKHTGEWYYRPVWKSLGGSDVCYDNAFVMRTDGYGQSIGIGSYNNQFGVYTESHYGHAFDFQDYSSLEVDIFKIGNLVFDVILNYEDGKGIKIRAKYICDSLMYFKHYSVDFSKIPDGKIKRMTFVFTADNNKIYNHINIGRLYLCPKNQ